MKDADLRQEEEDRPPWDLPISQKQWAVLAPWIYAQGSVFVTAVAAGSRSPCWLKGLFSYTFKPTMNGLAVRVRNDATGASLLARPDNYPVHFPDPL